MEKSKRKERPRGRTQLPQLPTEQIKQLKQEILDIIDAGNVETMADAARQLGISPTLAWGWAKTDEEFQRRYQLAREVVADKLEQQLLASPNDVAKIFLLKGLRPMYRENYRGEIKDKNTQILIQTLISLGKGEEVKEVTQTIDGEIKTLPEKEVENPFQEVIKRINSGEVEKYKQTQGVCV